MRDCPFCDIVARRAPAELVYEWGWAIAFVPLNPVVPGHTLIVPKTHVEDATEAPEYTAETMRYASHLARWRGVDCNLITSVGPAATQTVGHLHVHYVPRRPGDGLLLPWSGR